MIQTQENFRFFFKILLPLTLSLILIGLFQISAFCAERRTDSPNWASSPKQLRTLTPPLFPLLIEPILPAVQSQTTYRLILHSLLSTWIEPAFIIQSAVKLARSGARYKASAR